MSAPVPPPAHTSRISISRTPGEVPLWRSIPRKDLRFTESTWTEEGFYNKSPDELGQGGFGVVYRANWTHDDKSLEVAVKILEVEERNIRRRFIQEVSTMAQNNTRPLSLKLFGAGQDLSAGICWIVMELMPHGNLDDFIHKYQHVTKLSWPDRLHLMRSIAMAVYSLHKQGIWHRDLKPSNFLMDKDEAGRWIVKVCDLGCSDALWTHATTHSSNRRDAQKAWVGTEIYSAPEWLMLTQNSYTSAMDIYSLGIVLWELVHAERPYGGRPWQLLRPNIINPAVQQRPPLVEDRIPTKLRPHIFRLITECWQHYAAKRPTALQLTKWLEVAGPQLELVLDGDAAVESITKELGSSWEHAHLALQQLLERLPPLTSEQVHRILASFICFGERQNSEYQRHWSIPQFSGINQFWPGYNNKYSNREAMRQFYTHYYHCICDSTLDELFIEHGLEGDPPCGGPRQLPDYLKPGVVDMNQDIASIYAEQDDITVWMPCAQLNLQVELAEQAASAGVAAADAAASVAAVASSAVEYSKEKRDQ